LPEPWTMVRGPRSKHIGLWSTDLEPRIVGLESRFKLSGSRLVGAGPGLLKLVAGSGSNWVEGVGRMFAVLAARTEGGDGWVEAVGSVFFGGDERLATIQQIPLLAHATFLAQMESKSISSCEM
jgi:hypothetical protein